MKKNTIWMGALGSALLLVGCQVSAPHTAHRFELAATSESRETPVSASGHLSTGQLVVELGDFIDRLVSGWRILAIPSDLAQVVVTVQAFDGTVFSRVVERSALVAGAVSVSFADVPVGPVSVTIKAFDPSGRLIGDSTQAAAVTAQAVTTVVPAPGTEAPRPSSGGSGGSGGSSSLPPPVPGDLVASATISDSPTPSSGTSAITARISRSGFGPLRATLAAVDGDVWIWQDGQIQCLAPDGSVTHSVDWELPVYELQHGQDGDIFALDLEYAFRFDPATFQGIDSALYNVAYFSLGAEAYGGMQRMDVESNDYVWLINNEGEPHRLSEGYESGFVNGNVASAVAAVDGAGSYWISGMISTRYFPTTYGLHQFSRTGQWLNNFPLSFLPSEMRADASHRLWLLDREGDQVVQVSNAGYVLWRMAIESPIDVAFTPDGTAWVIHGPQHLSKVAADGSVLQRIDLGAPPLHVSATAAAVWIHAGSDADPQLIQVTP